MKQTGDLTLIKKINKSIVLEHIKSNSPVSRASIAELTGLTKATVSSLVGELIESSLVHEIGTGESSGGRKPVMLLFNGAAGYAIGVDLAVRHIFAVLTDLNGNIVRETRMPHDNASQEAVIDALQTCIRELADGAPPSPYGIVGIGIGIPGISDDGNVLFAPNLGWENVPLRRIIEETFAGIPVVIDNEANAGAVGEQRYGAGRDASHLVYVSIGGGIGTGIMIKGELYRGASGYSGEIGHMSIELDGKPCRCGNIGCWELYASENALLEDADSLKLEHTGIDSLLRMAEAGDARVVGLLGKLANRLGVGIVNIVNSFNPELIIIGGRLTAAEAWLKEPLLSTLERRSLRFLRELPDVQFAGLGGRSAVLGACSFAISAFFSSTKVSVE